MYPTSALYNSNIYALSRSTKGRVTFDISDITAAGDVTSIVVTPEFSVSNKAQLTDKIYTASHNIGTCEPDRFLLNGAFSFADDTLANNGITGYVSDVLCAADGTFSTYQTIEFDFGSDHSSIGLTITFDPFTLECADSFDVTAYNSVGGIISTVSITGNTLPTISPLGQLTAYRKVVITIKKWSVGNRRARVIEVDFGIVKIYTGDNLITMGLIEQMDLISANIPSAEFKFTVDNSDRSFNIMNPTGFYKGLQQQQKVKSEIGLDLGNGTIEYIPLGNYLLYNWMSDEGSMTASFTAKTNLDLMLNFNYQNLVVNSQSLNAFAVAIFAVCGITNYVIDAALSAITTNSLVKSANCRDILQMIAIAGCASIYVTRDNTIHIKQFGAVGAAQDTITLDNLYQEAQVTLDNAIKQVNVTYWTDLATSVVVSVNSSATIGDTMNLSSNTLINTNARATAIANWIITQKGYRAIQTATWRGNPAEEIGDIISIQNSYGLSPNSYVTKVQLDYAGYLSGVTEARGVPN